MPKRTLIIAHSAEAAEQIAEEHNLPRFTYAYSTMQLRGVRPGKHVNDTIYIQDNPPKYRRNWADVIAEARKAANHDGFEIKRVDT